MATAISYAILLATLVYGIDVEAEPPLPLPLNLIQYKLDASNSNSIPFDFTMNFSKAWDVTCGGTIHSSTVTIPDGNFMLRPITKKGPCKVPAITLEIKGNVVAPVKSAWVNTAIGSWLSFSNVDNLLVTGLGVGQIDGSASPADWWKACQGVDRSDQDDPCIHDNRPSALAFHGCKNLTVSGLKSLNPPKNHLSIDGCNGTIISHVNLIAPKDSPNTDGIDISKSTNVMVHDSFIATGDDCIAINNGCSFINITNLNCGPGHGVSVGSLKENADVEEVHVRNCTFNRTQNGARIKTWVGGSGFARKITFEDITLIQADNPILINQFYCPHNTCRRVPKGSAVEVSNVAFTGVHGTSKEKNIAINLNCSSVKPCHDIVLEKINITAVEDPSFNLKSACSNVEGLRSIDTNPSVNCTPKAAADDHISMVVDNVLPSISMHEHDDTTAAAGLAHHDEL